MATLAIVTTGIGWMLGILSPASINGLMGDPAPRTDVTTRGRVFVGQSPGENNPLGGDAPELQTYDVFGYPLTQQTEGGDALKAGSFRDYYMPPYDGASNDEPRYLSVRHFGQNALCIAAIGVVGPDKQEYHIMGDVMHQICKWVGFPSMRRLKLGDTEHTPTCFWMGGHPKWGYPNLIQIELRGFVGTNGTVDVYNDNNRMICASEPRLHKRTGGRDDIRPLVFWPPLTYADNKTNGSFRGEPATEYDPERAFNQKYWRFRGPDADMIRQQREKDKKRWYCKLGIIWLIPKCKLTELDMKQTYEVTLEEDLFKQTRAPKLTLMGAILNWLKQHGMLTDKRRRQEIGDMNLFDLMRATEKREEPEHIAVEMPTFDYFMRTDSTNELLTATHMCTSSHTSGPDYANTAEGAYCNMVTRQLMPLCKGEDEVECFDLETGLERPLVPEGVPASGKLQGSDVRRVGYEVGALTFGQ